MFFQGKKLQQIPDLLVLLFTLVLSIMIRWLTSVLHMNVSHCIILSSPLLLNSSNQYSVCAHWWTAGQQWNSLWLVSFALSDFSNTLILFHFFIPAKWDHEMEMLIEEIPRHVSMSTGSFNYLQTSSNLFQKNKLNSICWFQLSLHKLMNLHSHFIHFIYIYKDNSHIKRS